MKKTLLPCMTLAAALPLAFAGSVWGDDATARSGDATSAPKLKTCSGTVAATDPQAGAVSVKGGWRTRTFIAAGECRVSLEDRPEATLADLRPGQKVEIEYENARGVLVADRIAQRNRIYTGYLKSLDPAGQTFRVKHGLSSRNFTFAENGEVTLAGDKKGSLDSLKLGQTVAVVYESWDGVVTARRIEQKNPTYAGTIRAIDSDARTIRAKSLLSEKTFHLADGCKIVVNGKLNAGLKDLRIGETVAFTYEDTRGVLVASRIGSDTEEAAAAGSDNTQASTASTARAGAP